MCFGLPSSNRSSSKRRAGHLALAISFRPVSLPAGFGPRPALQYLAGDGALVLGRQPEDGERKKQGAERRGLERGKIGASQVQARRKAQLFLRRELQNLEPSPNAYGTATLLLPLPSSSPATAEAQRSRASWQLHGGFPRKAAALGKEGQVAEESSLQPGAPHLILDGGEDERRRRRAPASSWLGSFSCFSLLSHHISSPSQLRHTPANTVPCQTRSSPSRLESLDTSSSPKIRNSSTPRSQGRLAACNSLLVCTPRQRRTSCTARLTSR